MHRIVLSNALPLYYNKWNIPDEAEDKIPILGSKYSRNCLEIDAISFSHGKCCFQGFGTQPFRQ